MEQSLLDIRPFGHQLLVQQCAAQTTLAIPGTDKVLYRPDKAQDDTNICEVLAIGPECGKKRWRKEKGRPRHLNNPIEPGDLVMIPTMPERRTDLWEMPDTKYQFMVHEDAILAIVEE